MSNCFGKNVLMILCLFIIYSLIGYPVPLQKHKGTGCDVGLVLGLPDRVRKVDESTSESTIVATFAEKISALFMLHLLSIVRVDFFPPGSTPCVRLPVGLFHRCNRATGHLGLLQGNADLRFRLSRNQLQQNQDLAKSAENEPSAQCLREGRSRYVSTARIL